MLTVIMDSDIPTDGIGSTQHIDVDKIAGIAEVLSNQRRVWMLIVLQSQGSTQQVSVGDLANMVAHHTFGPEFGLEERKRITIAISQTHLPYLNALEVVEWRRDSGVVAYGRRFREVVSALGQLREQV